MLGRVPNQKSIVTWVTTFMTMISDKPAVRQDEELESHLNKGQFLVESPLSGFVPLQFCLFCFLISRLYQPSKDPTRPTSVQEHTRCYVMANARNGLIHCIAPVSN
jgi:hypothetical protein